MLPFMWVSPHTDFFIADVSRSDNTHGTMDPVGHNIRIAQITIVDFPRALSDHGMSRKRGLERLD